MDERRLEIKVGALVLAGIAGVLVLLWLMGELGFGGKPAVHVLFGHTGNVVQGAPVKLGGVAVGKVEEIELDPARRDAQGQPLPVRMALSVDERTLAALHEDAAVTVATVGPLGEPYLELWPGSQAAPPLGEGATLRGVDAPRLDVVALRLSRFLDAAGRVLEENPDALGDIAGLTKSLDGVLTENRGDLRVLTQELTQASKDLRALAQLARRSLEPGGDADRVLDDAKVAARALREDVPQLSNDARKLLSHAQALASELDAEDARRVKVAIERYAEAGAKLEALASRGERVLARIEAGEGTIGALQKDGELYRDLKVLVEDLRKHPWKVLWKD